MIPIPSSLVVQWNEKKIGPFQTFQDFLRAFLAGCIIAERLGQTVQDWSFQQEIFWKIKTIHGIFENKEAYEEFLQKKELSSKQDEFIKVVKKYYDYVKELSAGDVDAISTDFINRISESTNGEIQLTY